MKGRVKIFRALGLGIVLVLGFGYLGYFVNREHFWLLLLGFSILFASAYFFTKIVDKSWLWIFLLGLIIRGSLLLTIPSLSDDYARFLWDGELVSLNQNPYSETPRDWLEQNPELDTPYLSNLFDLMNSKDYYSVYPPSNQFIFWMSSLGAGADPWQGVVSLRLVIISAEIALFFILLILSQILNKSYLGLGLYWLNPLVILELTVNLHFEGLVLLTLAASLLFFQRKLLMGAGVMMGLAVGLKLLPLILLPSVFFFMNRKEFLRFASGFFLMILFCFIPLFVTGSSGNFLQSLGLYQGKFEFNASIYYLLREVGFWIQGYNTIATLTKLLSGLILILILWLSWKRRTSNLKELATLWTLCYLIYLLLQPIVHPWYLIPGFGLSLLTSSRVFFLWSWFAIWSYQAYSNTEFYENPLLLTLEYLPVFFLLFWEINKGKLPILQQTIKKI